MPRALPVVLLGVLLALPSITTAQTATQHCHEPPPPAQVAAPTLPQEGARPTVRAVLITEAPRIDGVLDEAVWAEANVVDTSNQSTLRLDYTFSPRMRVRSLRQYNTATNELSNNIRFNFIYRPGSDLYIVYNGLSRTGLPADIFGHKDRQLVVKMTYLLHRGPLSPDVTFFRPRWVAARDS